MRHFSNPNVGISILAFSLVAGLACQSVGVSASPSGELKHMFRQIDRQLCRSFNATGCKGTKHKAVPVAPKSEASPAKPPVPTVAPPSQKAAEPKPPAKESLAPPPSAPEIKAHGTISIGHSPTLAVPLPRLRPERLGEKEMPVAPAPKMEQAAIPKPAPVPVPMPAPAPPVIAPPAPHPMPDNTLFGESCFAALEKLGAKFDRVATLVSAGACSVSDAVKVSGVMQGTDFIKFPDVPTLNCGFALRFSSWVKEQAEPIVQSRLSAKIATIGTGPGYQCRGRNGDVTAKLSEHAFGNAVDIERLKLADGQVVEVLNAIDTSNKYQPVLADLRAAGCQFFMTVLGPGANSAHASHFHFDLERRGKKGDNKMCQ